MYASRLALCALLVLGVSETGACDRSSSRSNPESSPKPDDQAEFDKPNVEQERQALPKPDEVEEIEEVVSSPIDDRALVVGDYGDVMQDFSQSGFSKRDIWMHDPSTDQQLRRLTHNELSSQPDWSPNGEYVAYKSRERLALYALESGDKTILMAGHLPDNPDHEYDCYEYENPRWGPEGRYLVFDGTDGGTIRGYLYDVQNDCVVIDGKDDLDSERSRFEWTETGEVVREDGTVVAPADALNHEGCPDIEVGN